MSEARIANLDAQIAAAEQERNQYSPQGAQAALYFAAQKKIARLQAQRQKLTEQSATQTEHGEQLRQESQRGLEEARAMEAPLADTSREDVFRGQQLGLAQQLQRVATGQEAGAGELAARRAGSRAIAAQQAAARMGRGAGAAQAARGAARNIANIGLGTAGQAQQAALADQAAARGQLGQVLQQGRGLDQKTSLADQASRLQTMGMSQQGALAYLSQLYGVDQSEMMARLQMETARMAQPDTGFGLGDAFQVGGQLAATAIMKSDRRAKKDIKPADKGLAAMLSKLSPQEYSYKDEKDGKGRHISVMAQDLEESELGRHFVSDTPSGKVVNYGKGLGTMLAAVAMNNRRLAELEKKGGK